MENNNASFDAHGDENRHETAEAVVSSLIDGVRTLAADDFTARAAYVARDIRRIIREITPAIRSAARLIHEGDTAVMALGPALAAHNLDDQTICAVSDCASMLLGHRAIVDALADLEQLADFEIHLDALRSEGAL